MLSYQVIGQIGQSTWWTNTMIKIKSHKKVWIMNLSFDRGCGWILLCCLAALRKWQRPRERERRHIKQWPQTFCKIITKLAFVGTQSISRYTTPRCHHVEYSRLTSSSTKTILLLRDIGFLRTKEGSFSHEFFSSFIPKTFFFPFQKENCYYVRSLLS